MKKLFIFIAVISLFFSFAVFGSAATFSASVYGDTSYNSSQAMNLYSLYLNSEEYNPFSRYVILRSSQYEYNLIVEQSDGSCLVYTYNSQNTFTDHYSVQLFDSYLVSNTSDYTVVSNISSFDNALRSSTIETYIFQYVATRLLPVIAVVFIFLGFRSQFNPFKRGIDI